MSGPIPWPPLTAHRLPLTLGLRGIALSTPVSDEAPQAEDQPDFTSLVPWVTRVLKPLLPITDLRLVNVNIPGAGALVTGRSQLAALTTAASAASQDAVGE